MRNHEIPFNDLSHLPPADKLFRLGIGLRLVAQETTDSETKTQLHDFIDQLGL